MARVATAVGHRPLRSPLSSEFYAKEEKTSTGNIGYR